MTICKKCKKDIILDGVECPLCGEKHIEDIQPTIKVEKKKRGR